MVIVSGNSFLIYKQEQFNWGDFINWGRVYFCSVWSRIMNSSVDPSSRHQDTVCWAGFDGWWWQQLPNKEFISLSLSTSQDLKTTAGQHGQYQYWLHEYHRGEGRGGDCECQALIFEDIWRSVGVSLLLIFGSCITYNVLNRESERACYVLIVDVGVKMNVF